jgi:hypothetical protein
VPPADRRHQVPVGVPEPGWLLAAWVPEPYLTIFRRFLTPKFAVRDIGAKVVFYTIMAGTWLPDVARTSMGASIIVVGIDITKPAFPG